MEGKVGWFKQCSALAVGVPLLVVADRDVAWAFANDKTLAEQKHSIRRFFCRLVQSLCSDLCMVYQDFF